MRWGKKRLRIPENLSGVTCSTVVAHPWVFGLGKQEDSGFYLSPENAVNYLSDKLKNTDINQDVTVFMWTATTLIDFINVTTAAAGVFPIPALTQVQRRATSAVSLAESRMQLPSIPGDLPMPVSLSVNTTRAASGAQGVADAVKNASSAVSIDALGDLLTAFASKKAQLLADAADLLKQLQGNSCDVWEISIKQDTQLAVREMMADIPTPDAIFTVAVMFVGQDLGPLRGMVSQ